MQRRPSACEVDPPFAAVRRQGLTLPLIDQVHSHSIARLSLPCPRVKTVSNAPPAAAPSSAERYPRTTPTASTMVSASTNSTVEAKKEASTVGPTEVKSIICTLR